MSSSKGMKSAKGTDGEGDKEEGRRRVRSRWESVGSGCEIENYVCVWKVGRAAETDGSGFAEGMWTREGGGAGMRRKRGGEGGGRRGREC